MTIIMLIHDRLNFICARYSSSQSEVTIAMGSYGCLGNIEDLNLKAKKNVDNILLQNFTYYNC